MSSQPLAVSLSHQVEGDKGWAAREDDIALK